MDIENKIQSERIKIFKNLFKGRDDVFAIRWEKGNKSGYMPAYHYDRYLYQAHKMKGGTFQDFKHKSYLKLNDKEIEKHLNGDQLIGIYPLLTDNSSWFLVADFDKEKWIEESRKFISCCSQKGIRAYLERSRSGNGGHVWIFFDNNYPAIKSRRIFIGMLEEAGLFSRFDKSLSFDRVFPNQDSLSGKGLGNLIALPLFKKTYEIGNSCFVNPDNLEPYSDQWQFIKAIEKMSISKLDQLYYSFAGSKDISGLESPDLGLTITLNRVIEISRSGLSIPLINYLKEELNFANTEYIIKKKIGKSVYDTERFFKLIEETEESILIPKGFIGRLIRFCRENKIAHEFIDNRKKHKPVHYDFNATLRDNQKQVVTVVQGKDLGVIVAPPGSGKTVLGLKIISEKQQPALIIVHRKQLLHQWIERIEAFLGIPKNEIGKIGDGNIKVGDKITVATIQSLAKILEKGDEGNLFESFGTIIMDECHHVPAGSFRNVIAKLQTFYLYGLTATPFRKYNDGKLIFTYLGDIIAEIKLDQTQSSGKAKIVIRNTELDLPYNPKTDSFETVSKILIHDSTRNRQILDDVKIELQSGQKVVILTERKEHIESLSQYLKHAYETISLSGEDNESSRNSKWNLLKEGNYQVLITTGQFFGEGSDLQNVNCLFLVYPFSFEGKLIQYIGRVQRSEVTPSIYDYRDYKIPYLDKLFLKRNTYYRKIIKQATLFDDIPEEELSSSNTLIIDKNISIPFGQLDFQFGSVSFKYNVEELQTDLEFEIENLDIRPEFEVLKPYISKSLNMRSVKIEIHAEFENRNLISQLATSFDIRRISRDIIDGVKFKFVSKGYFIGKSDKNKEGLLTIDQISSDNRSIFNSEFELLDGLLSSDIKYKHEKHLRFLASRHEGSILKLRFVLKPFSFVFLISGKVQYHIVLETLDTEEATYIWHTDKTKNSLLQSISEIDEHLHIITLKGRQAFLESQPQNFSRIQHDYTEDRKGFIMWRDQLESQLV